ncbi:MAG: hypothetical protein J6A94_12725 [Lachnospiraceae bacterium]|nr:hypothetical protein [Lachnospiraceae bacterium]
MQSLYTTLKVNNEIELCEVADMECKMLIEREFLWNHISYYIRWPKPSLFGHKRNTCIICVHGDASEFAEEIVRAICDESGYKVRFLFKKSQNTYL